MAEEREPPEHYKIGAFGDPGYSGNPRKINFYRASTFLWKAPNRETREKALADAETHAGRKFMVVFGDQNPQDVSAVWLESDNLKDAAFEALKLLTGDPDEWTVERTEMYDCEDLVEVEYNGFEPLALEWGGHHAVIVEVHQWLDADRLGYEAETARDNVRAGEASDRERQEYERLKAIYGD